MGLVIYFWWAKRWYKAENRKRARENVVTSSYIDFFTDRRGKVIACMVNTYLNDEKHYAVKIELGKEYVVQPLNALKKKHRDRRCIVIGFIQDDTGVPSDARVKFLDTNRTGRVNIRDLIASFEGKNEEENDESF
ncbi:hypothetical protein HMPREF0083_06106 [Aneurinibacillus aneurinilyticus ATCC 12856]|jgi:hypothetical protein|uniref:EF-hand domain-containing protein n=1 Tax=Aneurinibacillus aneurinilyticus ATCC 12856 TaxID=649747 RepID=U1XWA6_ANEAE|nr:hypothetical protein HMPREF0083_06106 [Aneurinibacillus aneurinilyticus ATCC 12856]